MKSRYISIIIALVIINVALAWQVLAGSLDSPAAPASTSSYGLDDIYDRLATGELGSTGVYTEPTDGPGSTMNTLDEIMAIAPALDTTNGATTTQVISGTTFWGLTSGPGQWGPQTGTRPPAVVAKTGQTGCYNVDGDPITCTGTGQDGELQKGVAWPTPRFITGTTGIVTDTLTGLIWLEDANCTTFFSGDSTGYNYRIWSDALTAANSLANGYCGLTDGSNSGDWRLPNVRELSSLTHFGFANPAVPNTAGTAVWTTNGDPFDNIQSDNYWSSSTYANDESQAWRVHRNNGGEVNQSLKSNDWYVWPVRGGQ